MFFRQCKLTKGSGEQVAWLPETVAKVGLTVELKGEPGWKVVFVGSNRQSADERLQHELYVREFVAASSLGSVRRG